MHINGDLPLHLPMILKSYIKFPTNKPFTVLEWNIKTPRFLGALTEGLSEHRHIYGSTLTFLSDHALAENGYKKIYQSRYTNETKISHDVFSMVFMDLTISPALENKLFNVDRFEMPSFEEDVRRKVAQEEEEKERLLELANTQLDLGAISEDLKTKKKVETPEEKEERLAKLVDKRLKDRIRAWRKAQKDFQQDIRSLRDDHMMIRKSMEHLKPGGLLVMFTMKELIDDEISFKLANNFEDIRVLKLGDYDHRETGKFVILATKRPRASRDYRRDGVVIGRTREMPLNRFTNKANINLDDEAIMQQIENDPQIKEFYEQEIIKDRLYGEFTMQVEPLYELPSSDPEELTYFRIGPLTPEEVYAAFQKSKTIKNFQNKFAQTFVDKQGVTPTPLHDGHIVMLLTSGLLNGFVGKGPNQHLVKGTAIKESQLTEDQDEDGNIRSVEKEFYNIGVKYVNANGEFYKIM